MCSEPQSAENDAQAGVLLSAISPWGPFARATVKLRPAKAVLRSAANVPVGVVSASVSPLVGDRSGLAAGFGSLAAEVAPRTVSPGDSVEVAITGTVPARPGRYRADLDVRSTAGAPISTRLRVDVAASGLWGLLCLVAGLSLLGVVKVLSGEGDVEETTRGALLDLGAVHAEWDRNPPPASRAEAVASIEGDFAAALRALAKPRGFWATDRRVADAKASLAEARAAAQRLREGLTQPPGALETADLIAEWEAFKTTAATLAAAKDEPEPAAPTLPARVGALLGHAQALLVARPAEAYVRGLDPHVERVKLALAAGEDDLARALAIAARQWKRRAADDLEKRQATMAGFAAMGANMLAEAARLEAIGGDAALPQEARERASASLDSAGATLASGLTLKTFAESCRIVEEAETQAMRDQKDAVLVRLKQAEDVAGDELSLAPVDAVFDRARAAGRTNLADRSAVVADAFAVWRNGLGVVHDDEARAKILAALDAGTAAAAKQDKDGMSSALRAAQAEWQAYIPRHVAAAGAAAIAPTCTAWRTLSLQGIAAAAEQAKLQGGRPEAAAWEKELDRARLALLRVSIPDADCIGKISGAYGEMNTVSTAVFKNVLIDSGIPMDAQLDSARRSGDAETIALVEKLMTEPRDLKMSVETAEADRVAGQPIRFRLEDVDPTWRNGVDVVVNWGDQTQVLRTDAEKLREAERLEHAYNTVGTFAPSATAYLGDQKVGDGRARLVVAPAPARLAERLADIFLTAQFWLALVVASIVYFWRFHSGTIVFGAEPLHYVQAFALGFVAYAAVADLPKAFAELVLK